MSQDSRSISLIGQNSRTIYFSLVGRVAEGVNASFLRRPRSHDLGSTHTYPGHVVGPWIRRFLSLLVGFEQATNLCWKKSNVNRKTRKMVTPKRVRIRPK